MNGLGSYRKIEWVLMWAIAGCISFSGCTDEDESEAVRQHVVWANHGITEYSYELKQGCFCDRITMLRVRVSVDDNAIVAVRDIRADTLVNTQYWSRFKTIDELFDLVQRAEQEADVLIVEWDATYGFPTNIDIYWDNHATDAGWVAYAGALEIAAG